MKKVFKLYSNCIPVKGKNRSLICDLQRGNFEFIPNGLYDILKSYNGKKSVDEIKSIFENQYDDIIDEYFDFLLEKEFVFYTQNPNYFPKMDMSFSYPFEVSNAIVEIDSKTKDVLKIIDSLESVNCKFLEIRSYEIISLDIIENILEYISRNEMIISSVRVIIQFSNTINIQILQTIMENYPRVTCFIVVNSKDESYTPVDEKKQRFIFFTKLHIDNNLHCGKVYPNFFTSNIKMFTESINHNSCLHKKISIDKDGNIKNCPSIPQSFGNIKDTALENALNHPEFKKYWNLTKDSIEVCKDCEFRYICTDCRAYTEQTHVNPEGLDISKPLKCGYNPYTGEWEEWSTNPLKQKAIEHYGMQDLSKKYS
ncbi:grasp-with-spasm system SPASM domain peptide maturase [Chryseobacterium daecheongense]|uniref:grasp-with-spasm system SPASM domain peptide maturase n=1 Tax=Chryseobacterium daecheongense TaxID=192389 RepID=UPI001FD7101C|nr:grasp-with-spasm system SPASM domain peptide maturase [Chryseobacterium daecheongense]UOU97827.1 grasp-with-spasm system SPASM domain peptide maturase [Chryseobacterium daecheongense]